MAVGSGIVAAVRPRETWLWSTDSYCRYCLAEVPPPTMLKKSALPLCDVSGGLPSSRVVAPVLSFYLRKLGSAKTDRCSMLEMELNHLSAYLHFCENYSEA